MGLIQSKPQHLDAVDADHELNAPLRSTLKDLEHLFIRPQRLKFKEGDRVGLGGYGEVRLATLDKPLRNSREVAVKQLIAVGTKGDRKRLALRLARELKIWATLQHPNILELLGYYFSENYETAQLISVYMVNGNVSQYLNQNQPDIATRLKFVQDITSGLQYLHDFNPPISHGDLKPANVLISDELDAVICDFGVAAFINQAAGLSGLTTTRAVRGSPRYMSPELLLERELQHTLPSDIWAWACTTYEIFTDIEPYSKVQSNGAMIAEVVQRKLPGSIQILLSRLPQDETWPTIMAEVINDCWNFDSTKRPIVTNLIGVITYKSNELAERSTKRPRIPAGGAKRNSWVLTELARENIIPNPVMSLRGKKLEYPGAPSMLHSKGEWAGTRRNLFDRLKFGSHSQKGEERGTRSPVSKEPRPMSSIPASRVDKAPDNTFETIDIGVHWSNRSPSWPAENTPSKRSPISPSYPPSPQLPPLILECNPPINVSDEMEQDDHSGWLRKRGEIFKIWTLWYFVLKGPNLYCFERPGNTKIKGHISMTGYRIFADENVHPGHYGFVILHETGKPHYFSLRNHGDTRAWVKALMKATIVRDYTKPVYGSSNIATVPLSVARTRFGQLGH